jgi:mannitol/fructose-specific phosphotransferase system IIA component (Ntr-type)
MIAEYLAEERVVINLEASEFNDAVRVLTSRSTAPDPDELYRKVIEHEKLMTTCLGRGAALPRAQVAGVNRPEIIVGVLSRGIKGPSFDRRPVSIIFLHVFPLATDGAKILSQSLLLLGDENFRGEVLRAATPYDLIRVVGRWEQP